MEAMAKDFDAATPPDPKVLAEKLEMKDGMGSLNRYKSRSSPKWIKIVVIYFSIVIEIEPKWLVGIFLFDVCLNLYGLMPIVWGS